MVSDVAVVGAGAVGVTTAFELADRDVEVTLFERGAVADGASGRAAGICYDAYADRLDAGLAERALATFRTLADEGVVEFTDCPYVWLAREGDRRHARAVRESAVRMQEHGLDVTLLDPVDLDRRWPALETADVSVAAVAANAGYTDPGDYTREMASAAERRGVDLREQTPVSVTPGPDVAGDAFDAVVVAAGAHTRQVVAEVAPLPVKAYRVQALRTDPVDVTTPMLYDATNGYYLRPREGGLLVGDGTEPVEHDPDDWDAAADDWFVDDCRAYERTALGREWPAREAWAGLCTATPDGHPLVGELADGVYVATGWQGHGFMRAPAFGEQLAEEVTGGAGIAAFDPTRFDGDEEFEIVEGMALD